MALLRSLLPVFAFAALYAAIALLVENSYYQLMMTLVLVWACFGLSWNLFSGYTGLVSFGHAAFFGLGAYTTVLVNWLREMIFGAEEEEAEIRAKPGPTIAEAATGPSPEAPPKRVE